MVILILENAGLFHSQLISTARDSTRMIRENMIDAPDVDIYLYYTASNKSRIKIGINVIQFAVITHI